MAADALAEMQLQNSRLASIAAVLQSPFAPAGVTVGVAAPLEAGVRATPAGHYAIVLNLSNEARLAQPVSLQGFGAAAFAEVVGECRRAPLASGVLTDDFGPYAEHLYAVR
ncbi:MAG: hypothetical protein ACYC8T_33325 [Myxococcaceae bacterium]